MFSEAGVFRSRTISEERCWLEQVGVEAMKLTGVIMFVVGVKPVEVIKESKPRLAMIFEGVSMSTPSSEVLLASLAVAMFKVNGRFGFNLVGVSGFAMVINSRGSTTTGSLFTAVIGKC